MGPLEIRIYPDPVLAQASSEVSEFDRKLGNFLDQMAVTMYAAKGIGLASPQVGVLKRVVVIDVSDEHKNLIELINPTIVAESGEVSSEEGCLSIPDYRDIVKRSANVTLKAQDRNGKEFEINAEGLLAICIQHEIDHLNGTLFIDRMSRLKRELFRSWFKKKASDVE